MYVHYLLHFKVCALYMNLNTHLGVLSLLLPQVKDPPPQLPSQSVVFE